MTRKHHEVGLCADLTRDLVCVAAGNSDRERVVVEYAASGQGGREQRARPLGQLLHFRLRSAPITPRPAPMIGHLARPSFSSSRLTCRGRGGKASPTGSTSAAGW
jgi:hypothetical protein